MATRWRAALLFDFPIYRPTRQSGRQWWRRLILGPRFVLSPRVEPALTVTVWLLTSRHLAGCVGWPLLSVW
jgi:hypothetical protein